MPAKDPKEYMRARREKIKQELGTTELIQDETIDTTLDVAIETKRNGWDCGCRPGNLCIQHGIQRMSQKTRDDILNRINKHA